MVLVSRLIRSKEPWPKFFIKALLTVLVITAAGFSFMSRYRIGIDPQVVKCIPGITFYLLDLKDQDLKRDQIFVFKAYGVKPFFADGTKMVKYLRAMPGDKVEVTNDQSILVNGNEIGWGLWLSSKLNQKPGDFVGKKTLNNNEFWFMGLSDLSFDSRYWGSVQKEQVLGRAYPLF